MTLLTFLNEDAPLSMVTVGIVLAVVCIITATLIVATPSQSEKDAPQKGEEKTQKLETAKKSNKNKREVFTCPFSAESEFILDSAEHLEESPLDLYESWLDNLATRWLAAGLAGQDTPGILRMGLRRLRNSRYLLVEEPHRIRDELLLKKKALDDPKRFPIVYQQEPDSLEAQKEVLELFMAYLPGRYPDLYVYDKENHSITVKPLEETFKLADWQHRPLELCERIVQEDLILMRPGPPARTATTATERKFAKDGFYMAAASVVFSFNELKEKLGKPLEFIHAPVPGYERHLRRGLNATFNKLTPKTPMWRNNWGIAPSGSLDEPLYGSAAALENRNISADISREEVRAKFLKVEYQTISVLPRTRYLLFTVKTMVDPLSALEKVPKEAAACLANSIRGMSVEMQAYKGIQTPAISKAVLSYLDSISE